MALDSKISNSSNVQAFLKRTDNDEEIEKTLEGVDKKAPKPKSIPDIEFSKRVSQAFPSNTASQNKTEKSAPQTKIEKPAPQAKIEKPVTGENIGTPYNFTKGIDFDYSNKTEEEGKSVVLFSNVGDEDSGWQGKNIKVFLLFLLFFFFI